MSSQPEPVCYDFANLLFAGPCNAHCPACIGKQLDPRLSPPDLEEYPPRNLDGFIQMIRQRHIRQVVFSGTTTDPQLYRYEARLLAHLRDALPPETIFSLHTNGRMALRKMETFNRYDKAILSFPSFQPETYFKMMGTRPVLDIKKILDQASVPVKISCLVTDANAWDIPGFLEACQALGIRRLVLRKLYGEKRPWKELLPELNMPQTGCYRGNPVYRYRDMEVTLWDFEAAQSRSINLFSSGVISEEYLLAKTYPSHG